MLYKTPDQRFSSQPTFNCSFVHEHAFTNYLQESVSVEEAAKIVADYLVQEKKQEYVQYTSKAGGFKIWSSGMVLPSNIQDMLKLCTSSISSTFKDSPTKLRTRFLIRNC